MKKNLLLTSALCVIVPSFFVATPVAADELPTFRLGHGYISLTNSMTGRDPLIFTGSTDRGDIFVGDDLGRSNVFRLRVISPMNMWSAGLSIYSYYPGDLIEGGVYQTFRLHSSGEYPTLSRGICTIDTLGRDGEGSINDISVSFEQSVWIGPDREFHWSGSFRYCVTPEPTTASLTLAGLVILAFRGRR
jgi:hypothetical protein